MPDILITTLSTLTILLLIVVFSVIYYAIKVYFAFKNSPELENDSHWDEGFTISWYAEKIKISESSARIFLDLGVLTKGFLKDKVEGIDIYKFNPDAYRGKK